MPESWPLPAAFTVKVSVKDVCAPAIAPLQENHRHHGLVRKLHRIGRELPAALLLRSPQPLHKPLVIFRGEARV
jgi:hypothetical protein